MTTSAKRPRIAFRDLSETGKLEALKRFQPDYFDGSAEFKAAVLAHWNAIPAEQCGFMDDNSGRM